jgi:hypothetical protein
MLLDARMPYGALRKEKRMSPESITLSEVAEASELRSTPLNGGPISIRYKVARAGRRFSVVTDFSHAPLLDTLGKLYSLLRASGGEDVFSAANPNPASVSRASYWIASLYEDAAEAGSWVSPHVSADEEGDVALEWWKDDRKLTVYVSPKTVEYIKVERPSVGSDMVDGLIETFEDGRELWRWLTG